MEGYLTQVSAILLINIIMAYAAYLPLAAGQLNLGIAGFMLIGAYVSAVLSMWYGLPLALCIALGTLVALVAGLAIAYPMLRMRGIYLTLATFAFAEIVAGMLLNIEAVGGAVGLPVTGYVGLRPIVVTTFSVIAVVAFLMSTRFGLMVTAASDDPRAAAVFGVNVRGVEVAAFTIGAALAGLAGALYAHHFSFLEPQNFTFLVSTYAILYALLGGTQTWWGPLIGATLFTLVPELLRVSGEWRYVGFGVTIILLMVWRPEGLLTRSLILRLRFSGR